MAESGPQNLPQRHHYIPCFYTKRWTGSDGKLTVFRKVTADKVVALRKAPAATGYVDGLYTMPGMKAGSEQIIEERFYKPVDTRANAVLDQLERGRVPADELARTQWARFVMSLLFRNPQEVEATIAHLRSGTGTGHKEARRRYQDFKKTSDPGTFEEFMESDEGMAKRIAQRLLVSMADSEKIGTHIIRMKWGVVGVPLGTRTLLSSDRPVAITNGLSHPECEIFLPISPRAYFFAVHTDLKMIEMVNRAPGPMVDYLNEGVVQRAHEFVFSYAENRTEFIRENFGLEKALPRAVIVEMARKQRNMKRLAS